MNLSFVFHSRDPFLQLLSVQTLPSFSHLPATVHSSLVCGGSTWRPTSLHLPSLSDVQKGGYSSYIHKLILPTGNLTNILSSHRFTHPFSTCSHHLMLLLHPRTFFLSPILKVKIHPTQMPSSFAFHSAHPCQPFSKTFLRPS